MDKIFESLLDYLNNIEVIDTHEHLPSVEEVRAKDTDVIKEYLSHYFDRDLVSAGLDKNICMRIKTENIPVMQKWQMIEKYWEAARLTGYGRSLDIAARGLYGVNKIEVSTIEELNEKFMQTLKKGHFKKVLKDKCKISTSLLMVETLDKEYDPEIERSIFCDRDFFSPVFSVSDLVYPQLWSEIERIEKISGIRITSFNRWLEAVEIMIDKAFKMGAIALKNQLAYRRSLDFSRVTRAKAEEDFNFIFKTRHVPDWSQRLILAGKTFQDYMMHYILDIANKRNLIIQIHTGLQEGNGNILSNSNPVLLSNLFLEYPDVTFDIFHISYPYQGELAVLSKNYPNVYIDMCWAHIVSPHCCVESLKEWMDILPLNKISAFGGDYLFVDGVYGHLELAKENVAKALSFKISQGLIGLDDAKKIAKMWFYDNPKNIFKLKL